MIKSETYQGMAGLNYIQDSELAFSTIYVVKREGTQHDKFVSGSTNRTFIHDESTGKVSFTTVFSPGDEKVFVLYKTPSGSEPVTPPGVCVPVGIPSFDLPAGIVGVPYNYSFAVTGSTPIYKENVVIPAWASVVVIENNVYIAGTPDTETTETLSFDLTNCDGATPFSKTIEVFAATSTLFISNISSGGVFINSASGFSYVISTGSFPLAYGTSITGSHGAFASVITLNITGIIFPQTLSISKNGSLLQSVSVTADGDHSFSIQTFLSTDLLEIVLE